MNEQIQLLVTQCQKEVWGSNPYNGAPEFEGYELDAEKLAKLVVQGCIDKIETYRIPVGNSASGELACEWTYAALKEIRDDIRELFGVEE